MEFKNIGLYKTIAITCFIIVSFFLQENTWLSNFLPIKGRLLALTTIIILFVLYEFIIYKHKKTIEMIKENQADVQNNEKKLKEFIIRTSINTLYAEYISSNQEFITNINTIKHIAYLEEQLNKEKINSYTQDTLEFLKTKIKR